MKLNWNVLSGVIEKIKIILHNECFADGFSTSDTAEIYSSFCKKFFDHPKKFSTKLIC